MSVRFFALSLFLIFYSLNSYGDAHQQYTLYPSSLHDWSSSSVDYSKKHYRFTISINTKNRLEKDIDKWSSIREWRDFSISTEAKRFIAQFQHLLGDPKSIQESKDFLIIEFKSTHEAMKIMKKVFFSPVDPLVKLEEIEPKPEVEVKALSLKQLESEKRKFEKRKKDLVFLSKYIFQEITGISYNDIQQDAPIPNLLRRASQVGNTLNYVRHNYLQSFEMIPDHNPLDKFFRSESDQENELMYLWKTEIYPLREFLAIDSKYNAVTKNFFDQLSLTFSAINKDTKLFWKNIKLGLEVEGIDFALIDDEDLTISEEDRENSLERMEELAKDFPLSSYIPEVAGFIEGSAQGGYIELAELGAIWSLHIIQALLKRQKLYKKPNYSELKRVNEIVDVYLKYPDQTGVFGRKFLWWILENPQYFNQEQDTVLLAFATLVKVAHVGSLSALEVEKLNLYIDDMEKRFLHTVSYLYDPYLEQGLVYFVNFQEEQGLKEDSSKNVMFFLESYNLLRGLGIETKYKDSKSLVDVWNSHSDEANLSLYNHLNDCESSLTPTNN